MISSFQQNTSKEISGNFVESNDMSHPWLKDDFKRASRSRSGSRPRSESKQERKPKVDRFGRTLPSKSKSRSRSGSRGRSVRSQQGNRSPRGRGGRGRGMRGGDDFRRFKMEGRDDDRRKRRRRSSSSSSDSSTASVQSRLAASNKPKYLNARLFVANINSKDVTKDELVQQFEKYGNVVDVLVHPKNYAFIQYLREEHALLAVEGEHGSTMKGWRLDVKMARDGRGQNTRGRGRGGRGGGDRDRSPMRDPYADPFGPPPGGPRMPGPFPPHGEFGMHDPFFPDPYRRPFPEPWLPPDDPYRRDPYADSYRDPYAPRAAPPAPPPVIECEIFVVNTQLRLYGEVVERKIKLHNIITAVSVMPEGRTAPQMTAELTARDGLFAIFINPQNEMHRSLTLNILHGTPQEHRNMPMEDAVALVGASFLKYVEGLREKANTAAAAVTAVGTPSTRVFLPPSSEVAYLLNLLADNRALTVSELDTIIKYLNERRDKLVDAESRPLITDDGYVKSPLRFAKSPSKQREATPTASVKEQANLSSQQELTNKILSIFNGAAGNVKGVPPASASSQTSTSQHPRGTPAPPAPPPPPAPNPSGSSLINFDNPNVQKALDNLIQSSPNLLKNINTTATVSSVQMGIPTMSTAYSQGSVMMQGVTEAGQGAGPPPHGQGMRGYGAYGAPGLPPNHGHPPPMGYRPPPGPPRF